MYVIKEMEGTSYLETIKTLYSRFIMRNAGPDYRFPWR